MTSTLLALLATIQVAAGGGIVWETPPDPSVAEEAAA